METLYCTEITEIGPEAGELMEQGMLVLFAAGAPPELAEISVLHRPSACAERAPVPGDTLTIGARQFGVTAVGEKAWETMRDLGHATLKFNGASTAELPGEICVGPATLRLEQLVAPGLPIELRAGGR